MAQLRSELTKQLNQLAEIKSHDQDVQLSRDSLKLLQQCDKIAKRNTITIFLVNYFYSRSS